MDEQWRLLERARGDCVVARPVVPRVCRFPLMPRKRDVPGNGEHRFVDVDVADCAQTPVRAGAHVHLHDAFRIARSTAGQHHRVPRGVHEGPQRRVRQLDVIRPSGRHVDDRQAPGSVVAHGHRHARRVQKRIRRQAESPLRPAALRLHRRHRCHALAVRAVEVPPAGAVGDEVQHRVGRPFGLEDRLIRPPGDMPRLHQLPIGIDVRHPQLGASPGHAWLVPRQPTELTAVGAHARRGVEVVAAHQRSRLAAAQRHVPQVVADGRAGVVLDDADHALARTVQRHVGVAHIAQVGCER